MHVRNITFIIIYVALRHTNNKAKQKKTQNKLTITSAACTQVAHRDATRDVSHIRAFNTPVQIKQTTKKKACSCSYSILVFHLTTMADIFLMTPRVAYR